MPIQTRDYRPLRQKPLPGVRLADGRGAVGCWTFAEGAGGVAVDHSPFGNHGALVGGPRRVAAIGHALELDGVSQYVSIPHAPSLMPAGQMTLALATRNLVTPAQFDVILMKSTSSAWSDGFGLYYDSPSSTIKFFVSHFSTGGIATVSLTPTEANTLVATYDGANARLFANGSEGTAGAYAGGIAASSGPLELGRGRSDSFNIHGILEWVQLWNYAFSREDARLLSTGLNAFAGFVPAAPPRLNPILGASGTELIVTSTTVYDDGVAKSGDRA